MADIDYDEQISKGRHYTLNGVVPNEATHTWIEPINYYEWEDEQGRLTTIAFHNKTNECVSYTVAVPAED